jgi:hypothetical protein
MVFSALVVEHAMLARIYHNFICLPFPPNDLVGTNLKINSDNLNPNCKPFKEPRDRFLAWQNRFLISLNVYKFRLWFLSHGTLFIPYIYVLIDKKRS